MSTNGPEKDGELRLGEVSDLIGRLASRIHELRLQVPATLLLEMHRPLQTLAHTSALAFEPIATLLFGRKKAAAAVLLLSDPANFDALLAALERPQSNAPVSSETVSPNEAGA